MCFIGKERGAEAAEQEENLWAAPLRAICDVRNAHHLLTGIGAP